jgi:hypothetical protein
VIKQTWLNHSGGMYWYSVHDPKLKNIANGYGALVSFLQDVFHNCPDNYFNSGPRSSCLKFKLPELDIKSATGHEVSGLAFQGLKLYAKAFKDNHSKVQRFMLENDGKTIAIEVPIWLNSNEVAGYKELFNSKEPLTGHIDLLRIEDEKIWVWDYKPKANKEIYAATQVFFYSLMLSKRTGINLDSFRCGYFDDKYAFIFKPEEVNLLKNRSVSEFI